MQAVPATALVGRVASTTSSSDSKSSSSLSTSREIHVAAYPLHDVCVVVVLHGVTPYTNSIAVATPNTTST